MVGHATKATLAIKVGAAAECGLCAVSSVRPLTAARPSAAALVRSAATRARDAIIRTAKSSTAGVPFVEEDVLLFTAPTLGRPTLVSNFGGKSLHSLVHLSQLLLIKLCEPSHVVGSIERTRSLAAAIDQCLNRRSSRSANGHDCHSAMMSIAAPRGVEERPLLSRRSACCRVSMGQPNCSARLAATAASRALESLCEPGLWFCRKISPTVPSAYRPIVAV